MSQLPPGATGPIEPVGVTVMGGHMLPMEAPDIVADTIRANVPVRVDG